jgi:hypothetical protein
LDQTVKPDRLVLWLADEQFPNREKDLTCELLALQAKGLEIRWCEDLRSYKKLIPALKEFPEDIIVTADDDLYYQHDWLESLYNEYLSNPRCVCARRACGIKFKNNVFCVGPHYANSDFEPTFLNQATGAGGVLYPPHCLHEDIFNVEQIKTLIPTHDDIYFWIMAVLNGTKVKLVKNKDINFYFLHFAHSHNRIFVNFALKKYRLKLNITKNRLTNFHFSIIINYICPLLLYWEDFFDDKKHDCLWKSKKHRLRKGYHG